MAITRDRSQYKGLMPLLANTLLMRAEVAKATGLGKTVA
jgi:hypothetical protein